MTRYHHFHALLVSIFIFLFSMPFSYAEDLSYNDSKEGAQVYHLYGDINLVTTLKISYGKHSVVAKAAYPQLECDNEIQIDNFNRLVTELVQDEIAGFQNQVEQYLGMKKLKRSNGKSDFYIDYDSSYLTLGRVHFLSIRFSMQGYIAGMAHPFHYHRVLNYDLSNDEKIELTDLFQSGDYLYLLSNYSQNILARRLSNSELIGEGTAPNEGNFKNWNIKPTGLLITFDETQVAPSAYGAQSVLIPFYLLRPVAAPDTPLTSCFKYRRRCGRNNVVTGGFIDDA